MYVVQKCVCQREIKTPYEIRSNDNKKFFHYPLHFPFGVTSRMVNWIGAFSSKESSGIGWIWF